MESILLNMHYARFPISNLWAWVVQIVSFIIKDELLSTEKLLMTL